MTFAKSFVFSLIFVFIMQILPGHVYAQETSSNISINDIYGEWFFELGSGGGSRVYRVKLYEDGTGIFNFYVNESDVSYYGEGTYTIEGNKITMDLWAEIFEIGDDPEDIEIINFQHILQIVGENLIFNDEYETEPIIFYQLVRFKSEPIKVYMNDNEVKLDYAPIIVNDRVLLSFLDLKKIFAITYDQYLPYEIKKGSTVINFDYYYNTATVNGKKITTDTPASAVIYANDTAYAPLRIIAEALKFNIEWKNNSVYLYSK